MCNLTLASTDLSCQAIRDPPTPRGPGTPPQQHLAPSLSKNNQCLPKIRSHMESGWKTTKGELSRSGTQRGAHASLRVPTQCDILSNDRRSRWQEINTRVPLCILGLCHCHPLHRRSVGWLLNLSAGLRPDRLEQESSSSFLVSTHVGTRPPSHLHIQSATFRDR